MHVMVGVTTKELAEMAVTPDQLANGVQDKLSGGISIKCGDGTLLLTAFTVSVLIQD